MTKSAHFKATFLFPVSRLSDCVRIPRKKYNLVPSQPPKENKPGPFSSSAMEIYKEEKGYFLV